VRVAALLAALVFIIGAFEITRPGYSVDEEFTEFAVRGIRQHGLPILPSGLLYDRGLAYSYASAAAGARIVSLVCAALTVILTFVVVRRHAGATAGMAAAALVTTSIPFWATATTGRFYAPFLLLSLGALVTLSNPAPGTAGTAGTLGTLAFFARLTHELAFVLVAIPLVCAMFARGGRRRWLVATAATLAGLLIGQLVLFAMHSIDPPSGETMVRRFFLWQVLNLFERPGDRQFGIPFVVMVIGVLIAPRRAWLWIVSSLSVAVMIVAFSIARASNSAALSTGLVMSILRDGSRYPLDMFWHIARTTPLTLALAIGAIAARLAGAGGDWKPAERAAHLLWIGWVVWFGVIESGITTNYLLLPVSFMLIAIAIDVSALAGGTSTFAQGATADNNDLARGTEVPPLRARWTIAVATLVVAAVALDQWRGEGSLTDRLEAARPTINVAGIDEVRDSLQPNDRVVCTDELGCLMLVGRIDRWLALDDYVRERFLVRRTPAVVTGVYTGVPAVMRPAEVFSANADGSLPDRTIVIDIFKEYPIGNSRSWLPKAIEEDGLQVRPLLETPQVRVLQVSPPERQARLQP
jgi:hypothetical protein